MTKAILPVWAIEEFYDTAGNLIVQMTVMPGHNLTDGDWIEYSKLPYEGLEQSDLPNFNEDEDTILVYIAVKDPSQPNTSIEKNPGVWIHNDIGRTYLVLIHPETNGEHKKIKKTQKNVSDIKLQKA